MQHTGAWFGYFQLGSGWTETHTERERETLCSFAFKMIVTLIVSYDLIFLAHPFVPGPFQSSHDDIFSNLAHRSQD